MIIFYTFLAIHVILGICTWIMINLNDPNEFDDQTIVFFFMLLGMIGFALVSIDFMKEYWKKRDSIDDDKEGYYFDRL